MPFSWRIRHTIMRGVIYKEKNEPNIKAGPVPRDTDNEAKAKCKYTIGRISPTLNTDRGSWQEGVCRCCRTNRQAAVDFPLFLSGFLARALPGPDTQPTPASQGDGGHGFLLHLGCVGAYICSQRNLLLSAGESDMDCNMVRSYQHENKPHRS